MKNKIQLTIAAILALATAAMSQKNNNGKIFDEHPGIELMHKFTKAYVAGDKTTLEAILTDDFRGYNGLNTNKDYKGKDKQGLINESIYWSSQLKGFKITKRGKSYPDALEYKKSGTWIDTWDVFYGVDKETGFKIETPIDRSFVLSKDGTQIKSMIVRANMAIFQKYSNTFSTIENGTIYKDHPYINTVRTMISALELGDLDLAYEQFADNAKFNDINAPRGESHSKSDERAKVEDLLTNFEIVSMDEYGYPDYLAYNGDGSTVLSWWNFRFKNKATGEDVVIFIHLSHDFNKVGKIIGQVAYYDGSLFN
tara:strand:+ start:1171 stop:2103 length:933 start_codon:yes stop_codon:yes gene_type:complete